MGMSLQRYKKVAVQEEMFHKEGHISSSKASAS